jgi:S-(hydroxymethyl)glutathione dehydrogenase/alcohol dehydrogenase
MGHCDIRVEIPHLIGLYREGKLKLDELITARYGFDEINVAMDNVRGGVGLRNVIMFGDGP